MMRRSLVATSVSEWIGRRLNASPRSRSSLLSVAFLGLFWVSLLSAPAATTPATPPPAPLPTTAELAQRVVILANSDDPDSLRIARHYAEVRGVPAANIVALKLPRNETISWREFIDQVWNPLAAHLIREKWIEAIVGDNKDVLGRQKYAVYGHRISALVTCRGVPLRINNDGELFAKAPPAFARQAEFRTNQGAVDAELSLLAVPTYTINGFMPNPLFQKDRPAPFDIAQVVKVSRLDGPTVESALVLVDHAVEAERTGLLGRAYIDISDKYPEGNAWLEDAAKQLTALGFDTAIDRAPTTLSAAARIDAPVLYFGWYAGAVDGPFLLPNFQFPPGAIALHIHSFSADTLRSPTNGWTAPFVARGVTATVGNVFEPYLSFTHHPHLFLRALARGATLVDAAYYSLRALSWQQVLIGDPLYRPFAVPLEEQLKPQPAPSRLAGYAVLRQMHLLDRVKREIEATALAVAAQRAQPSLALGVAVARRLQARGDRSGAAEALAFASNLVLLPADEWALTREAARLLEANGAATRAVAVWRILLAQRNIPAELRTAWLPEARRAAQAASDPTQAAFWQKEIEARGPAAPGTK